MRAPEAWLGAGLLATAVASLGVCGYDASKLRCVDCREIVVEFIRSDECGTVTYFRYCDDGRRGSQNGCLGHPGEHLKLLEYEGRLGFKYHTPQR